MAMATRQKRSDEASHLRQPVRNVGGGLSRKPLACQRQTGETPRLRDQALTTLQGCIPASPCGERGNEPRQACRPSLRPCVDATDGNVGAAHRSSGTRRETVASKESQGVGQPASTSSEPDGAPVVVCDGESPLPGEAGQSDPKWFAAN